jgi:hypothetical protein
MSAPWGALGPAVGGFYLEVDTWEVSFLHLSRLQQRALNWLPGASIRQAMMCHCGE